MGKGNFVHEGIDDAWIAKRTNLLGRSNYLAALNLPSGFLMTYRKAAISSGSGPSSSLPIVLPQQPWRCGSEVERSQIERTGSALQDISIVSSPTQINIE